MIPTSPAARGIVPLANRKRNESAAVSEKRKEKGEDRRRDCGSLEDDVLLRGEGSFECHELGKKLEDAEAEESGLEGHPKEECEAKDPASKARC
jgi:hypothetical protein